MKRLALFLTFLTICILKTEQKEHSHGSTSLSHFLINRIIGKLPEQKKSEESIRSKKFLDGNISNIKLLAECIRPLESNTVNISISQTQAINEKMALCSKLKSALQYYNKNFEFLEIEPGEIINYINDINEILLEDFGAFSESDLNGISAIIQYSNGEPVGCLLYRQYLHSKKNYYYIEFLGVDPRLKGQGIGTALLNKFEKTKALISAPIEISLYSFSDTLKFYEKNGFNCNISNSCTKIIDILSNIIGQKNIA